MDSQSIHPEFAPVPRDEMAFAMSVFVEAAHELPPGRPDLQGEERAVCEALYDTLLAEADVSFHPKRAVWLERAFRTLCGLYQDDPLQAAICARVMAFHFMMERGEGAGLEAWIRPNPEAPELVRLHPALVDTMAEVSLDGTLLLTLSRFAEAVEVVNRRNEQTAGGQRPF